METVTGVRSGERRRAFRPGVLLHVAAGTADRTDVEIEHPWGRHRIAGAGAGAARGLLALASGFVGDGELLAAVAGEDAAECAVAELARLEVVLASQPQLVSVGVFRRDGSAAVVAVPMSERAAAPRRGLVRAGERTPVALPRHSYLRRMPGPDGLLVLESALSAFRAEWHDPEAASFVTRLGVGDAAVERDDELEVEVLDLLAGVGLLATMPDPDAAEPPGLRMWDFHDLLFHARSRPGRHDYPFGGLFRHAGDISPLPAVKPLPAAGDRVELTVPSFDDVVSRDPSLTEAIESRRSVRAYAAEPVSREQLGELLYRSMRVRGVHPVEAPGPYDASDRPFPTGGGGGDLEVYLTVASCRDLEAGAYHYDAAGHRLVPLPTSVEDRNRLLVAAWQATGCRVEPQVLLTITSRFGRMSWKYSGIAYAATLKHVGVLYQTLYLVATAMGLAPCALGSGSPEDAARAFGLDWTEESSVGEFLVGSPAAEPGRARAFVDITGRSPFHYTPSAR